MRRIISLRWPWLPQFAVCLLLAALEFVAALAVLAVSSVEFADVFAMVSMLFCAWQSLNMAALIFFNRPRRTIYGRIILEGRQ